MHSQNSETEGWGHSGADFYLMEAFVKAVAQGDNQWILTGILCDALSAFYIS